MERVDGSGVPRQLTRDGRVHVDAWSPDGRTLMVHKHPPLGGDSSRAGPLVTKTLLIYALTAGGTDDSPRLVALDKATGSELASVDLPGGAIGTPMTYVVDGKQHIALTVGGSRIPALISLALP